MEKANYSTLVDDFFLTCPAEVKVFEPELRAMGWSVDVLDTFVNTAMEDVESPVNEAADLAIMAALESVVVVEPGVFVVRVDASLDRDDRALLAQSRPDAKISFSGRNRMQHGLAHAHRAIDKKWLRTCVPKGARVQEMGGSIAEVVLKGLLDWCVTSPVFDMQDGVRGMSWRAFLARVDRGLVPLTKQQREVYDLVVGNPTAYFCEHKVESCTCGREYDVVLAAHSAYDNPVRAVATAVVRGKAAFGVGTLVYPTGVGSSDRGEDKHMGVVYEYDRGENRIRFLFSGDPSCGYTHVADQYFRWGYDQDVTVMGHRFAYRIVKRYTHTVAFRLDRVPTVRSYEPLPSVHWRDTGASSMVKLTGPRVRHGSWRLGLRDYEEQSVFVPADMFRRMAERGLMEGTKWPRSEAHRYAMGLNVFFVYGGKRIGSTERIYEEVFEYFVDFSLAVSVAMVSEARGDIAFCVERVRQRREGGLVAAALALLNAAVGGVGASRDDPVLSVATSGVRRLCEAVVARRVSVLVPTCHRYYSMEILDMDVTWSDGSVELPWEPRLPVAPTVRRAVGERETVLLLLEDDELDPDEREELENYLTWLEKESSGGEASGQKVPVEPGAKATGDDGDSAYCSRAADGESDDGLGVPEGSEVGRAVIQEYADYCAFAAGEIDAAARWFAAHTWAGSAPDSSKCVGALPSPSGRETARHSTDRMKHNWLFVERGVVVRALLPALGAPTGYAAGVRPDRMSVVDIKRVGKRPNVVATVSGGYSGWLYTNSAMEVYNERALGEAASKVLLDPSCGVMPPVHARYGVFGCGKTHLVVATAAKRGMGFGVLTSTKATAEDTKRRIMAVHPLTGTEGFAKFLDTNVRTMDSLELHGGLESEFIMIDEAVMVHGAKLRVAAYLTKATEVMILGDDRQITGVFREQGFSITRSVFGTPTSVYWENRTRRGGIGIAASVSDDYEGVLRVHPDSRGLAFDVPMVVVRIKDVQEVPKKSGVVYLAFTQDEKDELRRRGFVAAELWAEYLYSVHESQGKDTVDVILVRLNATQAVNGIYTWPRHVLVSLTRACRSVSYYTKAVGVDGVVSRIAMSKDPVRRARVVGEYDSVVKGVTLHNELKPLTGSELRGLAEWRHLGVSNVTQALRRQATVRVTCEEDKE